MTLRNQFFSKARLLNTTQQGSLPSPNLRRAALRLLSIIRSLKVPLQHTFLRFFFLVPWFTPKPSPMSPKPGPRPPQPNPMVFRDL